GSVSLHHSGRAEAAPGPPHGLDARRQAAAAAHEVLRVEALRDRQDAHARLQLDLLRPSAEEAFGGAGGDAVDAAFRASRARLRHQAIPALAAGPDRPSTSRSGPFVSRMRPQLMWPG